MSLVTLNDVPENNIESVQILTKKINDSLFTSTVYQQVLPHICCPHPTTQDVTTKNTTIRKSTRRRSQVSMLNKCVYSDTRSIGSTQ